MSDRIIALLEGQSADEWCKQASDKDIELWGNDLMGATELVDDTVFKDEKLPTWCLFMQEDWIGDTAVVLKPHHIKSALEDLERLVDRVAAMPFTSAPPIVNQKRIPPMWFKKYDFEGSPENVAICKEVSKVLLDPTHFNYPWQSDRIFGVPRMIEALHKVQKFMESNPDREVIALYY